MLYWDQALALIESLKARASGHEDVERLVEGDHVLVKHVEPADKVVFVELSIRGPPHPVLRPSPIHNG